MPYKTIGKIEVKEKLEDKHTFLKISVKRAEKMGLKMGFLLSRLEHHHKQ
jgi:hypothetical protein